MNQPGNLTTILYLQRDLEHNQLKSWKLSILTKLFIQLPLLNFLKTKSLVFMEEREVKDSLTACTETALYLKYPNQWKYILGALG